MTAIGRRGRWGARGGRILLVSMPFGALERPALGLSLLQPLLRRAGFTCDVAYLGFTFADLIGESDYRWLGSELPYTAFAGDWCFTPALYGERPEVDAAYLRRVLVGEWGFGASDLARLATIRAQVEPFLAHVLAAVAWERYDLVGFTSTFEQNLASLALAARLKAAQRALPIVFGGANWEGEMGEELHRLFPFVDYVCSGEAEESLPQLAAEVVGGRPDAGRLASIPGLVFRRGGETVATGPPRPVVDLDRLPTPDFGDYFSALERSSTAPSVLPTLLFETSRGCWWGEKSHCTFCGLNGASMAFRRKSAERVLAEINEIVERYRLDHLEAVDNILDMRFFRDLVPGLAARRQPVEIFFEVKANLTRDQVRALHAAGIRRIQPGIESLSDGVLARMRKGTTGLRNIQLLKWCRESGVRVDWNVLYGFPGETAAEYASFLRHLPAIRFLEPPGGCGPLRLDRFSPYHAEPDELGLCDLRPLPAYGFLYPVDEARLERIAYSFDYGYRTDFEPGQAAAEVLAEVAAWRRDPDPGELVAVEDGDGRLELLDGRRGAPRPRTVLFGPEKEAYLFCDSVHTAEAVTSHLTGVFPRAAIDRRRVEACLDSLVANRLMVSDGGRYLSLALRRAG